MVVVGWDLAVLQFLVGGVDFRDHSRVGECQNNQYYGVEYMQNNVYRLQSRM